MTRVKVVRGVSKAEWLPTVLKVMGEEGVDKIAVEGLARSLGITKAGFYWHFRIRRELYDALLEVWERVMPLADGVVWCTPGGVRGLDVQADRIAIPTRKPGDA